jgi:DNA-binding response OmpR family regulator
MKRVLVIDDNDFAAIYLEQVIDGRYEVEHEPDGEVGIKAMLESPPAIVLLDVEMPGLDGYQTCRLIRQHPKLKDIPVIFVSAHASDEDRLAGYQAGGDDYVTKPFNPDEVLRKIELLLLQREKNQALTEQVEQATSMAQMAMSSVGSAGVIMGFLTRMVACLDFGSVADALVETMDEFGLDVSIQLRHAGQALSRSRGGECTPLEINVLSNMATCDRIVDLGRRSAFNHPNVTIIVHNMPKNSPEEYGRIKDSMGIMAQAVHAHVDTLRTMDDLFKRGDALLGLVQEALGTLHDIDRRYRAQRTANSEILNTLVSEIEESFVHLGLTDGQEHFLQETLRTAVCQAQALYDQELEVDKIMHTLNSNLDQALQQELAGVVNQDADERKRIDLF